MTGNNGILWIIIIIALLSGNGGLGNIFGGCGNGCNNNDSTWLIILIIILFCCNGNGNCFNLCDNNC